MGNKMCDFCDPRDLRSTTEVYREAMRMDNEQKTKRLDFYVEIKRQDPVIDDSYLMNLQDPKKVIPEKENGKE